MTEPQSKELLDSLNAMRQDGERDERARAQFNLMYRMADTALKAARTGQPDTLLSFLNESAQRLGGAYTSGIETGLLLVFARALAISEGDVEGSVFPSEPKAP